MDYVTKDSGKRATFESGMVRDTAEDKANFYLLLVKGMPYEEQFLTRCASLMARGAIKYSARNYEQANSAEELDRFRESALRHLIQYVSGDTSEDHAAATVYNLLGATMVEWKLRAEEELEKLAPAPAAEPTPRIGDTVRDKKTGRIMGPVVDLHDVNGDVRVFIRCGQSYWAYQRWARDVEVVGANDEEIDWVKDSLPDPDLLGYGWAPNTDYDRSDR